jgi:predicted nucleic-acid-binding protein
MRNDRSIIPPDGRYPHLAAKEMVVFFRRDSRFYLSSTFVRISDASFPCWQSRQAKAAERAIEKALGGGDKLLIQPVVLCELVWVLEGAYGYEKKEIVAVIEQVMRTLQFEIAEKDVVWRALGDFSSGSDDFADYLIGRENEHSGANTTITFDKSLKASNLFTLL